MELDIIIKGGEELEKFYPRKYEAFKEKLTELILDTFHGVGGCRISSEPPGEAQAAEKWQEQKREDKPTQTTKGPITTYYYYIIIAVLLVGVCIGWFAHIPIQSPAANVTQATVPVQAPIIQKTPAGGSTTAIPTPTILVTPNNIAGGSSNIGKSGNTAAAVYQHETSL